MLRDVYDSFIRDQIRVTALDRSLESTRVGARSRRGSGLRDSTGVAKQYLRGSRRPRVRQDSANFDKHPEAHSLPLGHGKPAPATEAQDHVCVRKRRRILEDDQEILRPVLMQGEISPRDSIIVLDEGPNLVGSERRVCSNNQNSQSIGNQSALLKLKLRRAENRTNGKRRTSRGVSPRELQGDATNQRNIATHRRSRADRWRSRVGAACGSRARGSSQG